MATLKKVAQNSFFYTVSSILLRASSIIFFPIFSLYLTKSDYGIISITQSIGSFVTLFAGLELGKALTRFVYNKNVKNCSDEGELITTVLLTSFTFSVVLILLIALTGPFLLKPILNDIPFYPYVFVFLLSIPLNSFINTCRVYLKATHKGLNAFALDMSFFSSNILLNLLLVVYFKMDALGIFLGTLINTFAFSIILLFLFYRKFNIKISRPILKEALKYSLPLIPFSVLNILFESVDKFFLNADSGSASSGIYYIALTFAAIFSSTKESMVNAFTPWLFSNIEKKSEKTLERIITILFAISALIAISVSWFSKEILQILSSNPEFIKSSKFIPFTVMSLFIIFLGQLYNIKTYYYGKYNRYLSIVTLSSIIVDVIACYFFVEKYGIYGALISRCIAFSAHVIGIIFLSKLEKDKNEIYNGKILTSILIASCILILLPITEYNHILLKIPLYLIVTSIFLLGIKAYSKLSFESIIRMVKDQLPK